MFHPEFYPTPKAVIEQMGLDCYDKVILEPSAGKGNIIDYCIDHGASSVLSCEINEDLRKIIQHKSELIDKDFFNVTPEKISHVNLIVMNPPFSNAEKHILHAWRIAPEGCEIVALCNWETVSNHYGYGRNELKSLANDYGEFSNLGDCFSVAERKTGVEVGLIRLFKPVVSSDFDWEGFFLHSETEPQENGIISYNEVRAIVNTYVAAVECFDRATAIGSELNTLVGSSAFSISLSHNNEIKSKEAFARQFQIKCWNKVFQKLNIEKYVTKGVMIDINKFTTSRTNYPFTMKNVYRMIDIIIGTRENTMNRAIVEAVDNFTRNTHENRYGVEGWKTNEGHLLNKKFIVNYVAGFEFGNSLRVKTYNSHQVDYLVDLLKAICLITANDFNKIETPSQLKDLQPNTWYEWGFFHFKVFKKGTGHFKFKDEKVWELLNRSYAKIKGQVLPESAWRRAA